MDGGKEFGSGGEASTAREPEISLQADTNPDLSQSQPRQRRNDGDQHQSRDGGEGGGQRGRGRRGRRRRRSWTAQRGDGSRERDCQEDKLLGSGKPSKHIGGGGQRGDEGIDSRGGDHRHSRLAQGAGERGGEREGQGELREIVRQDSDVGCHPRGNLPRVGGGAGRSCYSVDGGKACDSGGKASTALEPEISLQPDADPDLSQSPLRQKGNDGDQRQCRDGEEGGGKEMYGRRSRGRKRRRSRTVQRDDSKEGDRQEVNSLESERPTKHISGGGERGDEGIDYSRGNSRRKRLAQGAGARGGEREGQGELREILRRENDVGRHPRGDLSRVGGGAGSSCYSVDGGGSRWWRGGIDCRGEKRAGGSKRDIVFESAAWLGRTGATTVITIHGKGH